ncbi:unnamed protein product [Clonostachys byssicola]|uniref:Phytanoyl-CoA hydroxylase n=1 Tax=Clonostachys byssicola TaxID=160290 RepID=A0A9N9Y363_9HYPO|nr:unnamed protein product [Clonostachys byssicola]
MAPALIDTPQSAVFPSKELAANDQYGRYHPSDFRDLNLESGFGPMAPEQMGYLQPTSLDTPVEVMRERFERDGYLLVKNVLPRDAVLECRKNYFEFVAPCGILKEGSDPIDGVYCGADGRKYLPPGNIRRLFGLKGDKESDHYVDLMIKAHSAPFYLNFVQNPELRAFIRKFTGWKSETMLTRTLLRPYTPNSEMTAVHYDQMYVRAGPPSSITAWVPLGGVSLEGGGLMYLERSHDIGKKTEEEFARNSWNLTEEERISAFNKNMNDGGFLSRDSKVYGQEANRKWLIAQYEPGDVVLHNPWIVHASCKNCDPGNIIRLATDLRFVESGTPHDQRWMKIFAPGDGV